MATQTLETILEQSTAKEMGLEGILFENPYDIALTLGKVITESIGNLRYWDGSERNLEFLKTQIEKAYPESPLRTKVIAIVEIILK